MTSGRPSHSLQVVAWVLVLGTLVLAVASLGGTGAGLLGLGGDAGRIVLVAVLMLLGLLWGVLASRTGGRADR